MSIIEALKKFHKVEIDLLLAEVLKKPKEFLFTHPETKLTNKQLNRLTKLVKHRLKGEPIAYIVGYKYFFGLKFLVNKSVLIPRPESEWLVETALSRIKDKRSKILEIGTGSGSIIISLAKTLDQGSGIKDNRFKFSATDISQKALYVARRNARMQKANVRFIRSDLFQSVPGKYDVIVANLPYLSPQEYRKFRAGLKFEPRKAITDGTRNWKIFHNFFQQAGKKLNPNGTILLELGPSARAIVKGLAKQYFPSTRIEFFNDLRGLTRYAVIESV